MSSAFKKEPDADVFEDLPDRLVSEYPNLVTAKGMAEIEASLAASATAYSVALASNHRAAMAAASRDLRYWTARRATARVVNPSNDERVRFGNFVTIVRDDGREQTFRIVGEDEADPAQGTISHASPLARAMLAKGVGEVIEARTGEAEIKAVW